MKKWYVPIGTICLALVLTAGLLFASPPARPLSIEGTTNQPVHLNPAWGFINSAIIVLDCEHPSNGDATCVQFDSDAELHSIVFTSIVRPPKHDIIVSIVAGREGGSTMTVLTNRHISTTGLTQQRVVVPLGDLLIPAGYRVWVTAIGTGECHDECPTIGGCSPTYCAYRDEVIADVILWVNAGSFHYINGGS